MRDKQEAEQKYEQLRHEMAEVRLIGLPSRLATTNLPRDIDMAFDPLTQEQEEKEKALAQVGELQQKVNQLRHEVDKEQEGKEKVLAQVEEMEQEQASRGPARTTTREDKEKREVLIVETQDAMEELKPTIDHLHEEFGRIVASLVQGRHA